MILAGQYFDAETGLHYNYHRYYDPNTGRYLTPDPIGLNGGINLYAYAFQNPTNAIDPSGLSAIEGTAGRIFIQIASGAGTATITVGAGGVIGIAGGFVLAPSETAGPELTQFPPGYFRKYYAEGEGDTCEAPTNNPYDGPIEEPVIVVDPNGNAIPVDRGEQIQTSPDGQWVDVKDSEGRSTGTQIHGPHKPTTHGNQPAGQKSHAHRPGDPGGNHWLPVY